MSYQFDINNPVPCEDPEVLKHGCFYLIPKLRELPVDFQNHRNPWCKIAIKWFFHGLNKETLKAKPGIDFDKALRHVAIVLSDFAPSHEQKMASAGWLLSQWFESYPEANETKG